uniref:Uncharacterized protein n=1 Tax=Wuchereria bancrofti TaxID=6293 RepID=A0A1I8EA75_WUCBA
MRQRHKYALKICDESANRNSFVKTVSHVTCKQLRMKNICNRIMKIEITKCSIGNNKSVAGVTRHAVSGVRACSMELRDSATAMPDIMVLTVSLMMTMSVRISHVIGWRIAVILTAHILAPASRDFKEMDMSALWDKAIKSRDVRWSHSISATRFLFVADQENQISP